METRPKTKLSFVDFEPELELLTRSIDGDDEIAFFELEKLGSDGLASIVEDEDGFLEVG